MTRGDVAQLVEALQARPGTYVLVLRCARGREVTVGRRGGVACAAGWYLYVGSAHGPGGVRARLGRHLRGGQRLRWHVDYLRAAMEVAGAWVGYAPGRDEHAWAAVLAGHPLLHAVPGIGASDCACATHLFHTRRRPRLAALSDAFAVSDSAPPEFELRL